MNCGAVSKESETVSLDLSFPTEELVLRVAQTFLIELSRNAAQLIGLAAIESGLIGVKDKTALARLVRAAVLGAHRAALNEITNMQTEKDNAPGN